MPPESSATDPNASGAAQSAADPNAGQGQQQQSQQAADPNAQQQQASDYWGKEWLGADGAFNHAAFEKAPDELKGLKDSVGRYKTADEFLKGFSELQKLAAKKGIVEPLPANATDAQKKERMELLRRVNGTPEKPDGYGFQRPQDLPEQYWNNEFAAEVQKVMHEEGVSPSAAKKLFDLNLKTTQAAIQQSQAQEKAFWEGQDKLARDVATKEGMPFDKVMEWAKAAGRRFGVSDTNPIMKNASALLALARVGRLLGESTLVTGDANEFQVAANTSPASAAKEASAIQTDKNHPLYSAYWNRDGKHSDEEVKKARATQRKYSELAYNSGGGRRR